MQVAHENEVINMLDGDELDRIVETPARFYCARGRSD